MYEKISDEELIKCINEDHDCRNGDPEDGCSICGEACKRGLIDEGYWEDAKEEYMKQEVCYLNNN